MRYGWGTTANTIVNNENRYNDTPSSAQQWVLMKFYIKNNGGDKLEAWDIIYKDNFYTESGASMTVTDTATFSGSRSGMGVFDVTLYSGASGYVWYGILVPKSQGYPVLKLENGYNPDFFRDDNSSFLFTNPSRATTLANCNPIYRLYNPNSGEHFYTRDSNESKYLNSLGWNYEGTGWNAPSTGTPVYRLYNPNATGAGSHHYTLNSYEINSIVSAGWRYEGVSWYGVR